MTHSQYEGEHDFSDVTVHTGIMFLCTQHIKEFRYILNYEIDM